MKETKEINVGDLVIKEVKLNNSITISNPEGKKLHLDFNTDKIKVSGDLKYDEAAKIFIDELQHYFFHKFITRDEVYKELSSIMNTRNDEKKMRLKVIELQKRLKHEDL